MEEEAAAAEAVEAATVRRATRCTAPEDRTRTSGKLPDEFQAIRGGRAAGGGGHRSHRYRLWPGAAELPLKFAGGLPDVLLSVTQLQYNNPQKNKHELYLLDASISTILFTTLSVL